MSLDRFITLWTHPEYRPDIVSEEALEHVEREFGFRFPTDYRSAVLELGLPRPTIDLLDAIVDRELDLSDVSDFLGPSDIIAITRDWRTLGLPENFVAFATDCMGNLFCFATDSDADETAPVFFFDHDQKSVDIIARSFTDWIGKFCSVAAH